MNFCTNFVPPTRQRGLFSPSGRTQNQQLACYQYPLGVRFRPWPPFQALDSNRLQRHLVLASILPDTKLPVFRHRFCQFTAPSNRFPAHPGERYSDRLIIAHQNACCSQYIGCNLKKAAPISDLESLISSQIPK